MLRPLSLVLFLIAVPLASQTQASVSSYGSSCGGFPAATISAQGVPRIGTTVYFNGVSAPCNTLSNFCWDVYIVGLGQVSTQFFSHPGFFVGNGCPILVTHDLALPAQQGASVPFAIPNLQALIGFQFYVQGAKVFRAVGWSSHALTLTNGLHFTVGL